MNENVKRRLRKRFPKSEETTESTQEEISEEQQPNDHQLAHECSLCDKVYSRHYRLKQHERQVHSIHVGRQCTVCMEVVGYDPLWREKKKSVIGDKKQFQKRIWKKSTSYSNTQLLTQLVNVIKSFFRQLARHPTSAQCVLRYFHVAGIVNIIRVKSIVRLMFTQK